jgi:hypothetical protein
MRSARGARDLMIRSSARLFGLLMISGPPP